MAVTNDEELVCRRGTKEDEALFIIGMIRIRHHKAVLIEERGLGVLDGHAVLALVELCLPAILLKVLGDTTL